MTDRRIIYEPRNEYSQESAFNSIDVAKFIGAIMIVMIHITPFADERFTILNFGLQHYLCRMAVPFYFVTSGFFLFRKMQLDCINYERVKDYCFKILRLYATWMILLLLGGTYQLWYLSSLVAAVIILCILLRYVKNRKTIIILSVFAFTIGLLGDSYYGLIEPLRSIRFFDVSFGTYESILTNTRNGLFFGLLYVLMGVLFSQKRIVMNFKVAVLGFVVSMILMLGEAYLLKTFSQPKNYNMYVFQVPAIFFLFYIVTHIKLSSRPIYKKLRIYGNLIFYLHLFVNYLVVWAIRHIISVSGTDFSAYRFIFVLLLSLALAILIERLSNRFKILRYLYS